jgi:amino acid transporter
VIAGFVVFPLVWSVPEALITAELATAFPENSGYVAWVSAAFGPFWGFQEGWWSWLSGVTDNSIYPVMLADNLRLFFPALGSGWQRCGGGATRRPGGRGAAEARPLVGR